MKPLKSTGLLLYLLGYEETNFNMIEGDTSNKDKKFKGNEPIVKSTWLLCYLEKY